LKIINHNVKEFSMRLAVRLKGSWRVLALGVALVLCAQASADFGKPINLKDVPANIMAAADKAVPQAKWADIAVKFPEGIKLYGKNAKGYSVVVPITNAAKVISVETGLPVSEVPEVVRAAVRSKYPQLNPKIVWAYGPNATQITYYKFSGKESPEAKKEIEVKVSADGRKMAP
jgi:hypothetical protein